LSLKLSTTNNDDSNNSNDNEKKDNLALSLDWTNRIDARYVFFKTV
jgi:hypothetical protein